MTDDLISREAAIQEAEDWIEAVYFDHEEQRERDAIKHVIGSLRNLPPAQPSATDTNVATTDTISREAAIKAADSIIERDTSGNNDVVKAMTAWKEYIKGMPYAQPGQRNARVFKGIIVEYTTISTYPEYKGKPYFSIKYTENGQEFIGYGTYKPEVLSEYLKEYFMPPTQPGWIPVTERLPENEQEVFVTVEVRPSGRKPFRRVVRAFYTDGRHTDADSAYSWDEFPDPQYDDDDNLIIPEGWWESSDYAEQQGMIDDFVIAWCEPLKPWEGGQDDGTD